MFQSDADIRVRPFPEGAAEWIVGRGVEPLWSPTGSEIFYRDESLRMVAVSVQTSPTFVILSSDTLFATDTYRLENNHRAYDVASDGQRFMMIRSPDEDGQLIWVQNFFEELRQRVPN